MNVCGGGCYRAAMSRGREISIPYSAACFLAHCLVRIEAGRCQDTYTYIRASTRLTLEEFLACVFFEESFMGDWTRQIVNHELKDGLDFLLVVTSIVG